MIRLFQRANMLSTSVTRTPLHFTRVDGVKLLHVGADKAQVKVPYQPQTDSLERYMPLSKNKSLDVSKSYLRKVCEGFSFSEDVVKERCFHAVPYDQKYLYEALDASDILLQQKMVKNVTGRYNTRGSDNRHLPCNLQKRVAHKLKVQTLIIDLNIYAYPHKYLKQQLIFKYVLQPIKRPIQERARQMHQAVAEQQTPQPTTHVPPSPTFLTDTDSDQASDSDQQVSLFNIF